MFRRGAQHPFAERVDEAGLLGERDEDLGRDAAVLGVVPAQQRLGADDGVVGEPHDRLIVEAQQALLQRVAQRALERVLAQPVLG